MIHHLMVVCTLHCAIEIFGQSCEKIQTDSNEHRLHIALGQFFCLKHSNRLKSGLEFGTPFLVLPEFVSYLGERRVLCVGNGSHFCTPVLRNMSNITFQGLTLSTFVFNKCSEKNIHDYICG